MKRRQLSLTPIEWPRPRNLNEAPADFGARVV
jgi:hypothetical protein